MVVHHQASPSDVTDFIEARRLFGEHTQADDEMIELGDSPLKGHHHTFEFDTTDTAKHDRVTPIPKAQLAVLCAVRLVDPIAFTQIFPYVNEMMEHLHLTNDPNKIGFYSGVVESSFSIAQLLTIYHWARISDVIGRRPVVISGILGVACATIVMGMSHSLFGVIFARSMSGLFSGNVAVLHSVLGELTDSTNQAVAFPIYGVIWPLGAIFGPLLGGTFSNPAERYPQYFGHPFLRKYPYFLPCFVASFLSCCGAFFAYLYLEETHPNKRKHKDYVSLEQSPSQHFEKPEPPATFMQLWSMPVIQALCLSGGALGFITTAFDVTFVLFCYTSVSNGGLSFTAAEIGYSLASSGLISICLQLFVMPFLLRRFNHASIYNFCMSLWPWGFILMPGLNFIARTGVLDDAGTLHPVTKMLVWLGIISLLLLTRVACLSFSVNMILLKDNSPNPASLSATNGIAQAAMCFTRSFSPAIASSLFALSESFNFFLLRYLWVFVLAAISFVGTLLARRIAGSRREHVHT